MHRSNARPEIILPRQLSVDCQIWPASLDSENDFSSEPVISLSPREVEILLHLSQGLRIKEVSPLLGITPETVRTHMRRVRLKLRARNSLHAVVKYLQLGENPSSAPLEPDRSSKASNEFAGVSKDMPPILTEQFRVFLD